MPNSIPFSLLVIPDDEPPVLSGTPYEDRARRLAGDTRWHFDRPADDADTIARIGGADAVINIRSSVQFTETVLAGCPELKILSVWGTGVNHVDLPAAERLGITVSNTPAYGAPYVAEHALTLALAVSRQIVDNDRHIRQGGWTRGFIDELYGKTLGVVGTGAIGQRMVRLGRGIGMEVIGWTPHAGTGRRVRHRLCQPGGVVQPVRRGVAAPVAVTGNGEVGRSAAAGVDETHGNPGQHRPGRGRGPAGLAGGAGAGPHRRGRAGRL